MFAKSNLKKAIQKNNAQKVRELLGKFPELMNQPLPGASGYSSLAYALEVANDATVDAVLDAGAVVPRQTACYTANIVHHAARYKRLPYLKRWVEAYPELAAARDPKYGYTLLHAAAFGGDAETAVYVLGLGGDPLATTKAGETALQICESRGNTVLAALMRPHADTTAQRLARGAAIAAESPTWRKIDDHTIAYSRADAVVGYRLTDIFNFSLGTCVTLHRNLETNIETPVSKKLDEMFGTDALASAEKELLRQGGRLPVGYGAKSIKG